MYSKILKDAMGLDNISDLCVSIDCRDIVYPLAFIRMENLKYLVVDSTRDDGTEGVIVIPKDKVLSVSVVYEQDIQGLFEEDVKDEKMFG